MWGDNVVEIPGEHGVYVCVCVLMRRCPCDSPNKNYMQWGPAYTSWVSLIS